MTLSSFMKICDIEIVGEEYHVTFYSYRFKKRLGVYVKDVASDFDAIEKAYIYLKNRFEK